MSDMRSEVEREFFTQTEVRKMLGISTPTLMRHRPQMARMGVKFHQPFGPRTHYKIEKQSFLKYLAGTVTRKFNPDVALNGSTPVARQNPLIFSDGRRGKHNEPVGS